MGKGFRPFLNPPLTLFHDLWLVSWTNGNPVIILPKRKKKGTHRNTFGQLVRDCTSMCSLSCCLSRLFISPVCQLRSWGEMRREVLKKRRYGLGRPPLGDNEKDWAYCGLCVLVYRTWGMQFVAMRVEKLKKMLQYEMWASVTLSVIYAGNIERSWGGGVRHRRFLQSLTFRSFSVSWTPFMHWVIAYGDLCLLSFPLITFTFCCCQCSDRQPTRVPQRAIHLALTLSLQLPKGTLPSPSTFFPMHVFSFCIEVVPVSDDILQQWFLLKFVKLYLNENIEIFDERGGIIQNLWLWLCKSNISVWVK